MNTDTFRQNLARDQRALCDSLAQEFANRRRTYQRDPRDAGAARLMMLTWRALTKSLRILHILES